MSDHIPQGLSDGETHTSVSSFLHLGLLQEVVPELNKSQATDRKQPGEEVLAISYMCLLNRASQVQQ